MPYNRPTLTELRARNQSFIKSELKTIGSLLRFSNVGILGDVNAGMGYLHYGYLDWIAKQSNPYTATDEFLAAWAALVSVYRKSAVAAACATATFTGTSGSTIDAASVLNRADGYQYTLDAEVTIGTTGTATGSLTAVLPDATTDSTGGGEDGNADAGTSLTFDAAISGVNSTATATTAITGGTDIEDEEVFRSRMLSAYQEAPQGGSDADYKKWALAVPGVTRAWVARRLMGAGTVGVYIMLDSDEVSNANGFPTGTDGLSSSETAYTASIATGDQLTVADALYTVQPATALVYICSPIKTLVPFTIAGLSSADDTTKASIATAIDTVFFDNGTPGGTIDLSDIQMAIGGISGTAGFLITSPSTNITMSTGGMPVLGTVDYT